MTLTPDQQRQLGDFFERHHSLLNDSRQSFDELANTFAFLADYSPEELERIRQARIAGAAAGEKARAELLALGVELTEKEPTDA